MPFKTFKLLDMGTVAANGGTSTKEWDFDSDYIIKRIYFVEKNDYSLSNVVGTIWIENTPLTKEDIPVRLFGNDLKTAVELDLAVKEDWHFKVAVKNNYTTARDIYVVLELHT